jgi:hypothetical protein
MYVILYYIDISINNYCILKSSDINLEKTEDLLTFNSGQRKDEILYYIF